jgi:hypothetical protein
VVNEGADKETEADKRKTYGERDVNTKFSKSKIGKSEVCREEY